MAAGYGTRMLPATKALPKEMLALVDRPVIHYAVDELVRSGVREIVIVTAAGKIALEDYFDRSRDLEDNLEKKGDLERLQQLRDITKMADIAYVRQAEARGLADAVNTARSLVRDEPFIVVYPDDIIAGEPPATRQLIDCYERYGGGVVAVEEVPEAEVSSYGIVAGETLDDRVTKLSHMVEKPAVGSAPSRLAIVGRLLLTPAIWGAIDRVKPGYGGELQLTDAMQMVAAEEGLYAYRFQGDRFDTGRPLSFMIASIQLALRRPDIAPALRDYLRNLNLEGES
ncbi:MAG TPA: UTP--glucose-1-phosphate uridylyltransferase [Dehalococcoidia bacterium]|nr:UTP--glucose-1-phosphate uridylyltransferase [Dehalococcoidia bacterium]